MSLPRTIVQRRTTPPNRGFDTDTGIAYVTGISERGPANEAVEIRNLSEFVDAFGGRQTYSGAYDWFDTYFHEGGARALFGRIVGPSPVLASKALSDGSGTAVTVRAKEYGAHASAWTIAVSTVGGNSTYTLAGTDGDGSAFTEVLGPYATVADAIAADPSDRISFVLGTGVDPVTAAAAALTTTTGTDDHANITATQRATARALFSADYGPGQNVDVDVTTTAAHAASITDAAAKGRVALLDYADTATAATILTALATDRAIADSDIAGVAYVNWLTIPPLSGASTERTVPPSALAAAIMARNDGAGLSQNEPPSGANGVAVWVTGTTQAAWSDTDRENLNNAGGNAILDRLSTGVTIYGARTLGNPDTTGWIWVSNARFYDRIVSEANTIGDQFLLGRLNPHRIAAFQNSLQGMLLGYYPEDLIGATPGDAFAVDISDNTDATMEAGELYATLSLRIAGVAEVVTIELVKVGLTEAVA